MTSRPKLEGGQECEREYKEEKERGLGKIQDTHRRAGVQNRHVLDGGVGGIAGRKGQGVKETQGWSGQFERHTNRMHKGELTQTHDQKERGEQKSRGAFADRGTEKKVWGKTRIARSGKRGGRDTQAGAIHTENPRKMGVRFLEGGTREEKNGATTLWGGKAYGRPEEGMRRQNSVFRARGWRDRA